jgi:amino acid transporter
MSKMFNLIKIYLTTFLVFSLFYLLLFQTPLFSSMGVLFYRGVLLLLFSFLLFVAGYFVLRKKIEIKEETFFAALVLSFSLHLAFFVVFPVTFERSVTMFFLRELSLAPVSSEDLEKTLIEDYVIGGNAVAKRIAEQKIIGFIDDRHEYLQITKKGRKFLDFADVISRIYGLK